MQPFPHEPFKWHKEPSIYQAMSLVVPLHYVQLVNHVEK